KIGLLYGDSAIFVRRKVYEKVGGFKPLPLFEDLDLVRRIRRDGRMAHLSAKVITSSRRFEGRSFTLTFIRWATLQMLYWLGVSPNRLVKLYSPVRVRK
ncbi:MAG TPA: glycosyl transferase, partial [Blastocatellia bacterium]|nr:glycosyl transferase [Blastocatellia bacterium]